MAAVRQHWPETPIAGIDEAIPFPGDPDAIAALTCALAVALHRRQRTGQQAG
ncbi:MAG: hypothetical protein ACR2OG_03910 [Gemmatimonadaceae bacterium]